MSPKRLCVLAGGLAVLIVVIVCCKLAYRPSPEKRAAPPVLARVTQTTETPRPQVETTKAVPEPGTVKLSVPEVAPIPPSPPVTAVAIEVNPPLGVPANPPDSAPAAIQPTIPPPPSAPPLPTPIGSVVPAKFEGNPMPAPYSPGVVAPPLPPGATEAVDCRWRLDLKVVKGRTIVTAKAGEECSFEVDCASVELQSPRGSLKAMGDVKISSPGLEGTCTTLSLNLQGEHVVLEGAVKVRSRRDGQDMELTGERLNLRVVNRGSTAEPPKQKQKE